MNRIIKTAAAALATFGLMLGLVPLATGGGATTQGTGSTGCCRTLN